MAKIYACEWKDVEVAGRTFIVKPRPRIGCFDIYEQIEGRRNLKYCLSCDICSDWELTNYIEKQISSKN